MEAREYAAAALSDLAYVPANRDEIVTRGIEPLVALLHEETRWLRSLLQLRPPRTNHQPNAAEIAKVGAIEPLFDYENLRRSTGGGRWGTLRSRR